MSCEPCDMLESTFRTKCARHGCHLSPWTTVPMATFLLSVTVAFAEFEQALIREWQREGITLTKKVGVYKSRSRSLSDGQAAEVAKRAAAGEAKAALAREIGSAAKRSTNTSKQPHARVQRERLRDRQSPLRILRRRIRDPFGIPRRTPFMGVELTAEWRRSVIALWRYRRPARGTAYGHSEDCKALGT